MSKLAEPKPARFFASIIYCPFVNVTECVRALMDKIGEIDFMSQIMSFNSTNYYEREMGRGLIRRVVSFGKLMPRDLLPKIKAFTNAVENEFLSSGKRLVNIDPGYVVHEHVMLATGKGYAHRAYLGGGVYAELTLIYRGNDFIPLEWTYPDYRTEDMRKLMLLLRERYIEDLKKGASTHNE